MMNERINNLIKTVKDLRYDANTGTFETDRRALYDFAELIVRECAKIADSADESACEWIGGNILTHFGVEE